jgi:hypothetical protein
MRLFGGLVALALSAVLTLGTAPAQAGKGDKKKKAAATVHGTVTKVDLNKDGTGTFTVKVAAGKKAGKGKAKAAAAGGERTFQVTKGTKFEAVGKKKAHTPTTAAALKPGATVAVTSAGNGATKVEVAGHAKKAKKAKKKGAGAS